MDGGTHITLHPQHYVILPFMGRISKPNRFTSVTAAWILPNI